MAFTNFIPPAGAPSGNVAILILVTSFPDVAHGAHMGARITGAVFTAGGVGVARLPSRVSRGYNGTKGVLARFLPIAKNAVVAFADFVVADRIVHAIPCASIRTCDEIASVVGALIVVVAMDGEGALRGAAARATGEVAATRHWAGLTGRRHGADEQSGLTKPCTLVITPIHLDRRNDL